jgi:FKBP-type peptidyl-prolyl cis-trans isomerase SlyD
MKIAKNTVVSIRYELRNSEGEVLEQSEEAVSYLHGGYDGIFPTVEEALHDKAVGDNCEITLEPDHAFGEYDADLVRIEPRSQFPDDQLEVGMQFEGAADGTADGEDEWILYTVTDVTDDKVVVDGNHPLAGQRLLFKCEVTEVRPATEDEIAHEHAHGEHGHHH